MLHTLISRATLEDLAGATAFQRGEAYFSVGAVERIRATDGKVAARVQGGETYQVELWDDDGELAHDCTCPRAADGYFCKHCVALGLAWLANRENDDNLKGISAKASRRDPWLSIKDYLSAQSPKVLIEMLLDVAQRDDRLYQSLLLKAETTVDGDSEIGEAFRRAIDDATHIRGYVDWREVGNFAGNIEQVADSLAEMLDPSTAATLIELTEYATERIEAAMEQVDDSNGELGGILHGLGELHLKACALARPDSEALAERLFKLETTLPFGVWSFDVVAYFDVLGQVGLRRYRELAEAEWSKIKPRDMKDGYDSRRTMITGIMERLAKASGDVDELVAVKARDLSSGYQYLGIAEVLTQAGRSDEALDWAERGIKGFPERPDNRLRDFLVAAYLARQRNDEALGLTWVQFEEGTSLETFKKLHDVATRLGIWPEQRERALAKLAEFIARQAATTSHWKPKASAPDYSLRVSIALWEQDLDGAWTAAHQGICDRNLLVTLAGQLESSRPDDAISLYRRVVPPIVEQTNNTAYHEAIKLIRKLGTLMKGQKKTHQFGDYLTELRVQYKPKRNFIKLLDEVARSASS